MTDSIMTNRRYLESLSDYDFASLLVWLSVGANVWIMICTKTQSRLCMTSGLPATGKSLKTTTKPSSTKSGGCGNARREIE